MCERIWEAERTAGKKMRGRRKKLTENITIFSTFLHFTIIIWNFAWKSTNIAIYINSLSLSLTVYKHSFNFITNIISPFIILLFLLNHAMWVCSVEYMVNLHIFPLSYSLYGSSVASSSSHIYYIDLEDKGI